MNRHRLIAVCALLAALAVVLVQRVLIPAAFAALDILGVAPGAAISRRTETPRPSARLLPPAAELHSLTRRELMTLAGTSRHLSKRELIARLQAPPSP